MFFSKCRCCPKSLSKSNLAVSIFSISNFRLNGHLPQNAEGPFNSYCLKRKYSINSQNLSCLQHQARSFYLLRDPSYYWYEVMENSKEHARGIKRKFSDLLNVVKNEISPKPPPPANTESQGLCARTIPLPETPSKYRKSLKPFINECSCIKESGLMSIPARPKDYERLAAFKELEEVNKNKNNFARSHHSNNVTGMILKRNAISYYTEKPAYFSTSAPYEVPGLKTDLLTIKVPHKPSPIKFLQFSDSDTQFSPKQRPKKEIYFTPKRLRKYPD